MQPDDALSAAATAEATASAVADRGKHLGLTWGLRLATVVSGTDPLAVLATYDGDDTPIGMTSMVGPLPVDARVYGVEVPPGGNFIIADTGAAAGFMGANTTNNGTVATSAGGAEAAIPSASWDNEPTFVFPPGRVFLATAIGAAFSAVATAQVALIRLREGTATTSGTVLGTWEHIAPAGFTGAGITYTYMTYFKNSTASAVSTKLSLTIQRGTGASNYSLYGDATVPLSVAVEDIGTIGRNTALASIAVSV